MSDNLKMWPEKVYVRLSTWQPTGIETSFSTDETAQEYIRADIAKEREAKLIESAYNEGALTNEGKDIAYTFDLYKEENIKNIYTGAELEELK